MPNGKILFAAGPISYGGGAEIFEYDPGTNAITQVSTTSLNMAGPPYESRMLMLPSGEVLYGDTAHQLWVYTPDAPPLAAGKPTISNIVANGTSFTLTGTKLNGISEGAGYGDDAQMASMMSLARGGLDKLMEIQRKAAPLR